MTTDWLVLLAAVRFYSSTQLVLKMGLWPFKMCFKPFIHLHIKHFLLWKICVDWNLSILKVNSKMLLEFLSKDDLK